MVTVSSICLVFSSLLKRRRSAYRRDIIAFAARRTWASRDRPRPYRRSLPGYFSNNLRNRTSKKNPIPADHRNRFCRSCGAKIARGEAHVKPTVLAITCTPEARATARGREVSSIRWSVKNFRSFHRARWLPGIRHWVHEARFEKRKRGAGAKGSPYDDD